MTDEELVTALADAMREARVGYYTTTAEILLPVVRRIAEQRAAAALRETANAYGFAEVSQRLLTRAAALTATPNHGRNAT